MSDSVRGTGLFAVRDESDSRILCDVTNCVYNDDNKRCTADRIKVGPQYASSSADTICVTFKQ